MQHSISVEKQGATEGKIIKRRYHIAILIGALLPSLALPFSVAASAALSQGFVTSSVSTPPGSLVSLLAGKQNHIELATSARASQLVGVVADKPLVELGSGDAQVQAVVNGQTSALVSDINGDIKIGDKITASPLDGIGMKALISTQIVGTAESNLSDSTTTTRTITDKLGKKTEVHIGSILVQVNVSYYSVAPSALSAVVPTFLLNAGSAIAGKDVSPVRILIAFSSLLVGFIIAGVTLHSAVRSGIISLGRNPLAHNILRQGLVDVLLTTLGLLVLTVVLFYAVLAI